MTVPDAQSNATRKEIGAVTCVWRARLGRAAGRGGGMGRRPPRCLTSCFASRCDGTAARRLNFEIANYNCSGLQIKSLKVFERGRAVAPSRWVRYVTYSNSYVCRV